MLIELHAHLMLIGLINQHPHWGPFFEQDEHGFFRTRVGDWTLSTVTKEQQAAAAAGTLKKIDIPALFQQKFGPATRLAEMDAQGVDKLVISIGTPYLMYWAEPEFNVRYASLVNDEFAAYCEASPERLFFWGHLPMQDPKASVAEARRAAGLGARGFLLGGARLGEYALHDPAFDPLWETLCASKTPLFVHGYNGSAYWGEKARDEWFDVESVLGMPYEESRVFWSLVNGGVLDRFPDLRIYITHGGGMVPFQLGRLVGLNETLLTARNRKPVAEYLGNFYFDALVHGVPMRQAIVETVGADRMLYGSSFGGSDGVREDLTAALMVSPEDREKIRWRNASELLRIPV